MSNETRTALPKHGRGAQFISRAELRRLRSLQNVNGDGVAVSSRGISISNKKRRAIPVEAPGFTYTGPFRAKIVDGGGNIQVGKADEVPAGLQDDYFIVDGGFDAMVDDLSFNTVSEIPASETATEFILSLGFQYAWSQDGGGGWARRHVSLSAGTNMGSPSYHGENTLPHINKVNTAPYDVSNNHLIPICRFTVNASRETTAIVQLQHGPIWVNLRKSNLFWDGEKVGFVHGGDGDIYSYTQNIPANTEDSIIYYDAAEGHMQIDDYFDDDANKSIIIGRITTNGQGRCTRLLDYTTMRPSSELYTDTIYAAI